jgi:PAS domain S-box-containing protein
MKNNDKTIEQLEKELEEMRRYVEKVEAGCKQKENSLKISDEKFKIIFEESLDAMVIINSNSRKVVRVNQATIRILGYKKKNIIGKHFSVFFPAKNEKLLDGILDKIKIHGSVFTQEFLHADGSIYLMDLTATVIPWGKDKALLANFRDIAERVEAEKEQEKLIVELKEAMDNIKTLKGLIPICSSCKKIRDDKGYWHQVESYIRNHTEAEFTHGLCPDCAKIYFAELAGER